MSKGHAAAALLSAPKEAEATERPLSILRTKSGVLEGHYTIRFLFPLSGWIALLPITQLSTHGERTARSTFLSSDKWICSGRFEIRVDNGCLVTTVKEVSPRVPLPRLP